MAVLRSTLGAAAAPLPTVRRPAWRSFGRVPAICRVGPCNMASERFVRIEVPPRASDPSTPELAIWTRRLAAVVASSNDAILTKDPTGVITSWNAGAELLYGYRAAEAIGRPITMLIPPERRGEEREILSAIMAGDRVEHYDTERVCKDGRTISVSLTISPVRDEAGAIVEASVIARDVTAARRADLQRERLQAVTAALSEATSAQDVVDVVLGEGFEAAEARAAVVALSVPGSDRVELLGLRGYSDDVVRELREMTVDEPVPLAEALRTGRPVWVEGDDAGATDSTDGRREATDGETALVALPLVALPLVVRGRTIGAVGLRLDRARRTDDSERRFMLTLAGQCAQALDRARLFEAER